MNLIALSREAKRAFFDFNNFGENGQNQNLSLGNKSLERVSLKRELKLFCNQAIKFHAL